MTLMESLRFGLVGCGRVAPRHAKFLGDLPEATLSAVADIVDTRADHFAREYGADAYYDYEKMLERDDLDVITVCTPSGLHAEMGIKAVQAGKHVLVEKPIALSLEDANALIKAASTAGVLLGVVLQNRYNPPMQKTCEAVRAGLLGRLLLGNATVRWFRPQEYYEDDWHGTLAMDGGALMNQSIHHIDALQWLIGDVESVFAYTATLAHQMEAEDTGVAVLKFKNGALGTVEGSTVTYPQNLEGSVAIFGEHGSIKVGGTALNRRVIWKIDGQLEHEREILTQEQLDPPSVYGSSHREVIADMIDAVQNNRPPQTNGSEAIRSLAIVLAIYESARTGQPVSLNNGARI
jgi:UDP-N-acetyl-2-amino-2-deoxyglucuronate dehydrogenase